MSETPKTTALILGAGKTGLGVAQVLKERNYQVSLLERNADAAASAQVEGWDVTHCETDEQMGKLACDAHADLVVASPGISVFSEALAPVIAQQEVISEVELAWRLQQADGGEQPWLCVTGTNGKTTTVEMAATILRAAGQRAYAVGNNGQSLISRVHSGDYDALVVELSSFQLALTYTVEPTASLCLNVAADHLDWHRSFEHYRDSKARVYENTKIACVFPQGDEVVRKMVEDADVQEGARAIGITLGHPGPSDFGLVEQYLVDRAFVENRYQQAAEVADLEELATAWSAAPSPAVVLDALAAAALTRAVGVEPVAVRDGLMRFATPGHRRHVLGQVAEVTWIDDSKATNAHAARASLAGIEPGRAVWIVGGLTKGQDLSELVAEVASRLRAAIIIGEDRTALREAFQTHAPQLPVVEVDGHEDFLMSVVHEAVALSRPGDTILLAPACASWDQFKSYSERGDLFADAVRRLAEQQA
ncbi:UDP-N-acetylmuramoylalanine--D-glutamate ligase [Boudabousia liubingyangii]|uniref:UDP-N-acetylmuramoylalanine--D-glutamate ligase n=1 Tax=Boudabousia liubingyangii TaxID=1921764 RepID=A0A1Q5PN60_9ACTO|nr:UDP-N-acetylmuramoyl-L-alanine--D-glutamate ligase [Boudabousia liubingyangii]OKL48966.1 UDP-N-acetylmuramoylalanine--D-glutamate ligase [Boudabousia liubingyangii]